VVVFLVEAWPVGIKDHHFDTTSKCLSHAAQRQKRYQEEQRLSDLPAK